MYWGAGRECRYQGQKGYRWHKGALVACRGVRGIGGVRVYGWLAGSVGTQGLEGV